MEPERPIGKWWNVVGGDELGARQSDMEVTRRGIVPGLSLGLFPLLHLLLRL